MHSAAKALTSQAASHTLGLLAAAGPHACAAPGAATLSAAMRQLSTLLGHAKPCGSGGAAAVAGFRSFASAAGGELHVSVEPQGEQYEGVSVISLNRPDARNAIGRQLLRELAEAINNLRQERTTRCVVIRSTVPGGV